MSNPALEICVPADLGESGTTVLGIANNIGTEITDLQAKLAPLAQYWVGTAADGHQVTQQTWNTAATNLMTDVGTLGDLAKTMGTNWNNYVDTEGANTKSWQH
jgi:uncharacterized protein YukE